MGALAGFGPAVYGLYKGMDDQTRLDQERQRNQFDMDQARTRARYEAELQPLRIKQARGAIDMLERQSDPNSIENKTKALQFGALQSQADTQRRAQEAQALLQKGMQTHFASGGNDFSPFEQSLSTVFGKPVSVKRIQDANGTGLVVQHEGGEPLTLYDGKPDASSQYPGLATLSNLSAANKLFHINSMLATPGGVAAAMKSDQDRAAAAAKEAQAIKLEGVKTDRAESVAGIRADAAERAASVRSAAMLAAIGGRDAAAERKQAAAEAKQAKRDEMNDKRAFQNHVRFIASTRGSTGQLGKLINDNDQLILPVVGAMYDKMKAQDPNASPETNAVRAFDTRQAQLSSAKTLMQKNPARKLQIQEQMRAEGWPDEAIVKVTGK